MDFDKIFSTYFNDVYLYIKRLSDNENVADEITGETFFKAMRSIDSFRGECDIRVWLCQIAKNCYYTYLKKNRLYTSIEDTELQSLSAPDSCIEELIIAHDEASQIRGILHMLPNTYKEVFMWRVFADLSFKQIGQIFNKSDNWACVTYHRARIMIKTRLEESKNEE